MNNDSIKFDFWRVGRPFWRVGRISGGVVYGALAGLRVGYEKAKASRYAVIAAHLLLAVLVLTLWTIVSFRVAQRDAQESFEAWKERFADEYISQREAAEIGMPIDPIAAQEEWDIDALAKMLYGVKQNSETDLRTYVWAAFNRVDIKSGEFKDVGSLSEVFAKPGQFMGYSDDNPVIGSLRKIAESEFRIWKDSKYRPVDVDYVFIYWTPDRVMLLQQIGDMVHTWRYADA